MRELVPLSPELSRLPTAASALVDDHRDGAGRPSGCLKIFSQFPSVTPCHWLRKIQQLDARNAERRGA